MVVRPLTIVNSKLDAREVERIILSQSGQSAGQGTIVAPATGRPRVLLTVHVGGAGNVQSVHRAVPYPVSSVQTVSRPSAPPPGLASVTQVEAISNAVMAQMSGMFAAFHAQISDLSAKVN